MTPNSLLSQALLLTGAAVQLLLPGMEDGRLIALLGAALLLSLMNLLNERSFIMHLLLAVYMALCVTFPHFLPFCRACSMSACSESSRRRLQR